MKLSDIMRLCRSPCDGHARAVHSPRQCHGFWLARVQVPGLLTRRGTEGSRMTWLRGSGPGPGRVSKPGTRTRARLAGPGPERLAPAEAQRPRPHRR